MKRFVIIVAISTLAIPVAGCGAKRVQGWEVQQQKLEGDAAAVKAEADAQWLKRDTKEGLEQALALYEKSFAIDPAQLDVATRLARGYYFLSDAYYQGDKDGQLTVYDKAAIWGERAMAIHPKFLEAMQKIKELGSGDKSNEIRIQALKALPSEYVEAIYWTAVSIGKWARLQGFTTILSRKNEIKTMVEIVSEKAPSLFYGAPTRYWGTFYAVAPSFAGGDVAKSKENFDASIAASPDYFGTKVLYADAYATKVQDCGLFKKLLGEVLSADVNVIADIVPEQMSEQRKATALLAQAEDLFADCPANAPAPATTPAN